MLLSLCLPAHYQCPGTKAIQKQQNPLGAICCKVELTGGRPGSGTFSALRDLIQLDSHYFQHYGKKKKSGLKPIPFQVSAGKI